MKGIFFVLVIVTLPFIGWSQGVFGGEAGMGRVSAYGGYQTPTISGTYLKYVIPHVYLGTSVDWRYFSFMFTDPLQLFSDPNFGTITAIDHHSLYLFISPMVDISIGENQYIHFNLDAGPGLYLGGSEQTTYEANAIQGLPVFNNVNTTSQSNKVIYQLGYGLTEYIPTRGYWSIKLSQQFSTLGRNLNSGNVYTPRLITGYTSFTIGISHYYKRIYYRY